MLVFTSLIELSKPVFLTFSKAKVKILVLNIFNIVLYKLLNIFFSKNRVKILLKANLRV